MLNDKRWQEAQISIDLSWALGVECMELTQKRWACACALCFAMPKLESISVLNTLINLNHLVRTVTHLDARALSHGTTVVNDDQQQSVVYKRSRTDSPRGEARSPEAGNGHSHSLTRVKSHAAKVRVAAQVCTIASLSWSCRRESNGCVVMMRFADHCFMPRCSP